MRWGGSPVFLNGSFSTTNSSKRFSLIQLPGIWSFDLVLSEKRGKQNKEKESKERIFSWKVLLVLGIRLQYRPSMEDVSSFAESERVDSLVDAEFHYVGIVGKDGKGKGKGSEGKGGEGKQRKVKEREAKGKGKEKGRRMEGKGRKKRSEEENGKGK